MSTTFLRTMSRVAIEESRDLLQFAQREEECLLMMRLDIDMNKIRTNTLTGTCPVIERLDE